MNQYKRAKLNKILIIVAVVLVVIAIAVVVTYAIISSKKSKQKLDYNDTVIGKNYYVEITIDTENKKVKYIFYLPFCLSFYFLPVVIMLMIAVLYRTIWLIRKTGVCFVLSSRN